MLDYLVEELNKTPDILKEVDRFNELCGRTPVNREELLIMYGIAHTGRITVFPADSRLMLSPVFNTGVLTAIPCSSSEDDDFV